jgi:hypothetical protein
MMTLEEAKSSIAYVKIAHPEKYTEMGGDTINDDKIEEALNIAVAVAGAVNLSEDELLKRELTRICNDASRS